VLGLDEVNVLMQWGEQYKAERQDFSEPRVRGPLRSIRLCFAHTSAQSYTATGTSATQIFTFKGLC
jgi:hypothetical protein